MSNEHCEHRTLAPGTGSETEEVGTECERCRNLRIVEAQWECNSEDDQVRCGDEVRLQAEVRGRGSRRGQRVEFALEHLHTGQEIASLNAETRRHRAGVTWTSQKQCDEWGGPEAFFTARAGGDSRESEHLAFHRYPCFAERLVQVEGLENPRLDLEFAEGQFTLGVKLYLIRRSSGRPEADGTVPWTAERAAEINEEAEPDARGMDADWVEEFQNRSQAVFANRWLLHRRNCQRGDACDCPVSYQCCKFPLRVRVQFRNYTQYQEDLGLEINTVQTWNNTLRVVNVWPNNGRDSTHDWYTGWSSADPCPEHQRGFRGDCTDCQRLQAAGSPNPCSSHAFHAARQSCPDCVDIKNGRQALIMAHEVGHCMGFYDEYPQGTHAPAQSGGRGPWQTNAPANLMGLSQRSGLVGEGLPAYYFEPFREFFSKRMWEEFDLIPAPQSQAEGGS